MGSETVPRFPVLDLSGENLKPGSSSWLLACNDVRRALEEYSFFEVVCNKLSTEFQREILAALDELFKLPHETKMRNKHPKLFHGYLGQIRGFPEGIGIEYATNKDECRKFTSLMWPDGNENFCEIVHSYATIVSEVHQMVVRMLFESYGIDEKICESHINSTTYLLKLLKYARSKGEITNVGLKAHMDKTFLTLLHQNQVSGLQFRIKEGEWISYKPSSSSSFVVLAGEVCMAWSNDRIKSAYHRVIVDGEETRYSLGLFQFLDGVIETPKQMIDDEHPLLYKPFENKKLIDFYDSYTDPNKRDYPIIKVYCGI